jgi:hypothetical protein
MIKNSRLIFGIFFVLALWPACSWVHAAAEQSISLESGMALVRAVMCEYIKEYEPQNAAAVFGINVGKVSCFTSFGRIKTNTAALHKWYRRDELITAKRLTLKPPGWSTYSSIQLREADKGPWRVEIWDDRNQLLQTLRFSVTD